MPATKKIVQIESIYPGFANHLYREMPSLAGSQFQRQIKAVLDSGWSAGQNVVPHLDPSKWSRYYLIPKLVPAQTSWARENNLPHERANLRDILAAQLKVISPQVIYVSDLTSFDFSILDELDQRPFLVSWLASRLPDGVPWKKIDLLLSGISSIRDAALAAGVRAAKDFNSAAPSYYIPDTPIGNKRKVGVAFSGSFIGGYHDERAQTFAQLACRANSPDFVIYTDHPFSIPQHCSLIFKPAVYGWAVLEAYARYSMVIDARADFGLNERRFFRDTSNMRIFEATRAGSLLLTEYAPNLEAMFEIGSEIICYKSDDELSAFVSYYSSDKGSLAGAKIAAKGFLKAISCHSIEQRAAQFASILEGLI